MPDLHVRERRIYATEFRDVPGSNGRQRWATAVTYNRADDYGTIWLPGVFNAGLEERMPTILYGHDWYSLEHVLGQGIDYRDTPSGCDVLIEFADPDQVSGARLAMTLTAPPNPVLSDVSVGFDRQDWIERQDLSSAQLALGATEAISQASMDELSIVVRGAVPGAQMREKRSWVIDGTVLTEPEQSEPEGTLEEIKASARTGVPVFIDNTIPAVGFQPPSEQRMPGLPFDTFIEVAKRVAAGDITEAEGQAALKLLDGVAAPPATAPPAEEAPPSEEAGTPVEPESPEPDEEPQPDAALLVTDDDIDALIAATVGRSKNR